MRADEIMTRRQLATFLLLKDSSPLTARQIAEQSGSSKGKVYNTVNGPGINWGWILRSEGSVVRYSLTHRGREAVDRSVDHYTAFGKAAAQATKRIVGSWIVCCPNCETKFRVREGTKDSSESGGPDG